MLIFSRTHLPDRSIARTYSEKPYSADGTRPGHVKNAVCEDVHIHMGANGDGMVSKEEFMKAREAMFERMKGPNGMISLKDMGKHHQGMMNHGQMKGHGSMMDKGHQQYGNPGSGMK
jgi:hypothetical protein